MRALFGFLADSPLPFRLATGVCAPVRAVQGRAADQGMRLAFAIVLNLCAIDRRDLRTIDRTTQQDWGALELTEKPLSFGTSKKPK